jgi:hypothetical protein
MSKKQSPTRNSRGEELHDCEKKILEMFMEKKITISEAMFVFEKIKFAAFYGEMTARHEARQKPSQSTGSQAMFR